MPEIPDIDRLIAEVAARHGILLKKDDAAFALVTLNQLILEAATADLAAQMRTASAEFAVAMERVQEKAGITMAKQTNIMIQELAGRLGHAQESTEASPSHLSAARQWELLGAFAAGSVFGVLLFFGLR